MFREIVLDPLTVRELSGVARRWQTYAARGLYVALLAVVILAIWTAETRTRGVLSYSAAAEIGRSVFLGIYVSQVCFVPLLCLVAAADMIAKERRSGTLGLLALTPLSSWRIVSGKWKAVMAQASTIILCGLPAQAACVFLGGVGLEHLLVAFVLTGVVGVMSSSASIFFSTVFRTAVGAVFATLLLLAFTMMIPFFAWLMGVGRHSEEFINAYCYVHAGYAAAHWGASLESAYVAVGEAEWPVSALAACLGSAGLLALAAARTSGLATAVPRPPLQARVFGAVDRFYERLNRRVFRRGRTPGSREGVWDREPLLWKELRTRVSGKLRNGIRLSLALLVVLILPLIRSLDGDEDWLVVMLWIGASVLLFVAIMHAVALFVKEREERKWDILLSTPLSPWAIIRAKVVAGIAPLLPIAFILLLVYAAAGWIHSVPPAGWLLPPGSAALFIAFAYLLGARASLTARSMKGAFTFTVGMLVLVLVGVPFVLLLLDALPGWRISWRRFPGSLMTVTNPVFYLEPVESMFRSRHYYYSSYGEERLRRLAGFFAVYAAIYAGGCVCLVLSMRRAFRRLAAR